MEKSSFFNSVNGDRKYKAEDFASYFNSLITNGVFPNPSTNLQIIANNNMTITIKAGKAWVNGYVYINDSDLALNVDVSDGVLKRIDRVVIQFSTINREIKTKIKKGTFASNPIAPILQRDADIWELGIADILVNNGAISITQANITDLRLNTTYCGIVNSIIQADTTTIFNQYMAWYTQTTGQAEIDIINLKNQFESDFNTWFTTVQGTLSGDVAGNLLNLINENVDKIGVLKTDFDSHKADDTKHIDYAVASGTNTYTATIANVTVLTEGLSVKIKFTNANTGAGTLNINSLGAKIIQKGNGNPLSSGNIKAGQICHLVYTGSVFQLLGEGGEYGTAGQPQVLTGYSIGTDNGLVNGTMPNNGVFNLPLGATVPPGYYSGGTAPSGKQRATGSVTLSQNTTTANINVPFDIGIAYLYGTDNGYWGIMQNFSSTPAKLRSDGNGTADLHFVYINNRTFNIQSTESGTHTINYFVYEI